jgi:rSAM/selenodomain-associated transferase 1
LRIKTVLSRAAIVSGLKALIESARYQLGQRWHPIAHRQHSCDWNVIGYACEKEEVNGAQSNCRMATAALGIMCKAPRTGATKTRLAPMLGAEDAAILSACFLRDVAAAIEAVPESLRRRGFGVYSPAGSEAELRAILPESFKLVLQENANFGVVLLSAARTFFGAGHDCAILINSDSPTLPTELLSETIDALRMPGDRVVLGPATDGGYYLIGLKAAHAELFCDIPWSTPDVFRFTLERARDIDLAVVKLPVWYDVDDAATLAVLERELAGDPPPFAANLVGGSAVATRAFIEARARHRVGPVTAAAINAS